MPFALGDRLQVGERDLVLGRDPVGHLLRRRERRLPASGRDRPPWCRGSRRPGPRAGSGDISASHRPPWPSSSRPPGREEGKCRGCCSVSSLWPPWRNSKDTVSDRCLVRWPGILPRTSPNQNGGTLFSRRGDGRFPIPAHTVKGQRPDQSPSEGRSPGKGGPRNPAFSAQRANRSPRGAGDRLARWADRSDYGNGALGCRSDYQGCALRSKTAWAFGPHVIRPVRPDRGHGTRNPV